jgi:hypothetical protein
MQKFADCFVRNPDGSWFCRAPAEFIDPHGERHSLTPGVTYRPGRGFAGVDIAKWLDDWQRAKITPAGFSFP